MCNIDIFQTYYKTKVMIILQQLRQTQEKTLRYFELPESEWHKSYAEDKWTIKEILHHQTDADTVLYYRIRKTISEEKPLVFGFDQDAWVRELDYDSFPLSLNKEIYRNTRNAVIHLAEKFYMTKGHRTFVHNETGLLSLKDLFDKVAVHNAHHLEQIERALGKGF